MAGGGCGRRDHAARVPAAPSSTSLCLRFCSPSECWTFQQIRTVSNCAGDCARRCATTGAGAGDRAEPVSIVTPVYGGFKKIFLFLGFLLALFALGNMVHYFPPSSYLAVPRPVQAGRRRWSWSACSRQAPPSFAQSRQALHVARDLNALAGSRTPRRLRSWRRWLWLWFWLRAHF